MTQEQRRRIVSDYLDASARQDYDRMGGHLTEDFTLWMVPSARAASPLEGRDTFLDFVKTLHKRPDMWKIRTLTPRQFLFDEDSVAVRVHSLGDFPSGVIYDNEYVFIYKFAGERICEMREFTDAGYIASLRQKAIAQAG
jgi:ketosteroid isomerase-like protein